MSGTTPIKYDPEPSWKVMTLPGLREAAKSVLGRMPKKRTIKGAYEEIFVYLSKDSGRDLAFTCQNCNSLIDDKMEKCWACGLVFSDDSEEEPVVDDEVTERAKKLGISVDGVSRVVLLEKIEAIETTNRKAKENVDLLGMESARLNEIVTGELPDGWRKSRSKQYVSYFDGNGKRRFAIWHRGLRIDFSVEDEFLDGFPNIEFLDAAERKRRHYGRTNYLFVGDSSKVAIDLVRRVFKKYQEG